jgi:hypothetical protein
MMALADATEAETRRFFSTLEANYATTLSVTTMYFNQGIPTTYRI